VKKTRKNDELIAYLLNNPERLRGRYSETATLFNTSYEAVRGQARKLRTTIPKVVEEKIVTNEKKDSLSISVEDSCRVKSLDDLITACSVDLDAWEIDWYDIGTYEVTGFDDKKRPITVTMYRTKAKFKLKPFTANLAQIREDIKEDISTLVKGITSYKKSPPVNSDDEGFLLEIAAYDLHLNKLGINGDEYSLEIARNRLLSAIDDLIDRSSGFNIDKILFTVGNDFLNSDGDKPFMSTTKGTPQLGQVDSYTAYRYGRLLIMEAINILSQFAPVHVNIIPGNHDEVSMLHLGDALEMYYEEDGYVTVDNSRPLMKGFVYGNSLIVCDHGDKTKAKDLGSIIPVRFRHIWSDVKFVEVHRGHFHGVKTISVGQAEEVNGMIIRHLSSMSATDQWHDEKNYIGNIKRAHAFVWSKTSGMQCEYYYNV
jgi:hypothetical protein|tara:strand:+ start:2036 stop:3316 length:1281 start_codon:yes stop_codon:yes gene_type:complete